MGKIRRKVSFHRVIFPHYCLVVFTMSQISFAKSYYKVDMTWILLLKRILYNTIPGHIEDSQLVFATMLKENFIPKV